MAAWFGHTQTITSISKSVSTVANGAIGLEKNLTAFMHKVIYYDHYFQRMKTTLPPEVVETANLLFARCYEYRDEIRDELESSLAYVADAGRWLVGLEDWNAKMDKRWTQISELVLLANTLSVEYAVMGRWGAEGSKDALGAYLNGIAASIVLNQGCPRRPIESKGAPSSLESVAESTTKEEEVVITTERISVNDEEDTVDVPSQDGEKGPTNLGENGEDEDVLNPFAESYQPPRSNESSIASLASVPSVGAKGNVGIELSEQGSLYHQAMDDDEDQPDSLVSLGEYECLEIDSIPEYVAFKPSALSRKRRLQQRGRHHLFATSPTSSGLSISRTSTQSDRSSPTMSPPHSPVPNKLCISEEIKDRLIEKKQRQRLLDLNYSYDFQREVECNPFASPTMRGSDTTPFPRSLSRKVSDVDEENDR